jgi:alkylation response protein AidB-like acyl-CoA dehydrogenase
MEVLGPEATIQKGHPRAALDGLLEIAYRGAIVGTFGGGVNEVQREIIGAAGLGMPRVPR